LNIEPKLNFFWKGNKNIYKGLLKDIFEKFEATILVLAGNLPKVTMNVILVTA
jgi:hypothetical protein